MKINIKIIIPLVSDPKYSSPFLICTCVESIIDNGYKFECLSLNIQSYLTVQAIKNCCRRMGRNLEKTCAICFKTMRGDNLKRHMLKHEKGRKGEMNMKQKKEEYKDSEVLTEVMGVDQNDEMLERSMQLEYEEKERKIKLGRRILYFTYENNINTDLLEGEDKEALNMYLEYGYM